MKLVLAIINHDDAHGVIQNLTQNGYHVTKLATTGGFLQTGNVTIMVGVEEEKQEGVMDIIKKYSNSRRQIVPCEPGLSAVTEEVMIGGATAFVLDVDSFHKF
ncbi:MAG: cyclic-di-AMP receptor [Oscillospiraceae bacterium]|nr:cyclic-di-AMP receptor [Oscillospiraceae bacterium]